MAVEADVVCYKTGMMRKHGICRLTFSSNRYDTRYSLLVNVHLVEVSRYHCDGRAISFVSM